MSSQTDVPPEERKNERAIVLQLLRNDHNTRWPRAELAAKLGLATAPIDAALRRLIDHGVAQTLPGSDDVQASVCARRLDSLGVIGI